MKRIFILSLMVLGFAACSKKSGSNSSGVRETELHREGYQFSYNNCDTRAHGFISARGEDALNQLCQALQDDVLNHSCAENLRRDYFEKKCPGMPWQPIYAQVTPNRDNGPPPNAGPGPLPLPQPNLQREQKVQYALRRILVSSYEVPAGLSDDLSKSATQLSADMRACGMSSVGPKCLNYHTLDGNYLGSMFDQNGQNYYVTENRFQDWKSSALFVFRVKETPQISADEVTVYLKLKDRPPQEPLADYLTDKNSVQVLSKVEIVTQDLAAVATSRLEKPRDLRELYHLADLLKKISQDKGALDPKLDAALANRFLQNRDLFAKSTDLDYLYRSYLYLSSLTSDRDILIGVAEAMVKVDKPEIQQYGAVEILAKDKSRTEFKPLVFNALTHPRVDVRVKAIGGLSSLSLTAGEQNRILPLLDDSEYDVREAAAKAANSFQLAENQLPTLKSLLSSSYSTTRINAIGLIGKLRTQSATSTLVSSLSDSEYDVRQEVYRQLDNRTFSENDVPDLKGQLQGSYSQSRLEAARLMGRIDADSAKNELIAKMSDSEYDVREAIFAILQKKTLTDANLAPLKKQMTSSYSGTRSVTAMLLGKMATEKAVTLLIDSMADQEYDVRTEIYRQLSAQKMQESYLPQLTLQFKSSYAMVREYAVQLIAKIRGDAATKVLIGNTSDQEYDVRQEYFKALDSRQIGENMVTDLAGAFKSDYSAVRSEAAKLLGKIKSPSSLTALKNQLARESEYSVKEDLKKAIGT